MVYQTAAMTVRGDDDARIFTVNNNTVYCFKKQKQKEKKN